MASMQNKHKINERKRPKWCYTGKLAHLDCLLSAPPLSFVLAIMVMLVGCTSIPEKRKDFGATVHLPFMRVESGECYYIDDFLPTPDLIVTGKSAGLFLRYYTYQSAIYKIWEKEKLMLAFYSRDNRCWSLFEEYLDRT